MDIALEEGAPWALQMLFMSNTLQRRNGVIEFCILAAWDALEVVLLGRLLESLMWFELLSLGRFTAVVFHTLPAFGSMTGWRLLGAPPSPAALQGASASCAACSGIQVWDGNGLLGPAADPRALCVTAWVAAGSAECCRRNGCLVNTWESYGLE